MGRARATDGRFSAPAGAGPLMLKPGIRSGTGRRGGAKVWRIWCRSQTLFPFSSPLANPDMKERSYGRRLARSIRPDRPNSMEAASAAIRTIGAHGVPRAGQARSEKSRITIGTRWVAARHSASDSAMPGRRSSGEKAEQNHGT